MALTKAARSKILSFVQDAKRLLIKEVEEQLQQYYGIRPDGTVLMIEQLTTSESEIIYTARLLRQRLEYLKANLADEKNQEVEAVRQLVREQAFTILNRFASLRMAEERGIIKETIRKEYNSEGFELFDSITGQGQTATLYIRYKWYLYAIFDELALDLPAVFDRYSPYALIFPSEQAMNRLLDIINNEGVTLHREEGLQPVNLWKEDETIGWVYQYYNNREEISAMREASGAPRNSQELAVRNQFFTPRYVVQFLTDNSLGRIWYEMTQGNTVLKTVCPYLIIRPNEVFLNKGETKPEKTDEETQYIDYRPIKDPREILLLDPACGSMHFGLYAFDLMESIYVESWDNYPDLLTDLRNSMTRQAFVQQIPEFIIRNNIHGVDIDPRALQIAGLSLWLRAQKSFDKQNLAADQRPQITRSNLVLAEPMPGSVETLSQLVQPLDAPMRKLVLSIWEQMKLAGETGLLLRIEEEIDNKIQEIAEELADENTNTQLTLGGDEGELQAAEKAALYATKKYRDSFLDSAETEVLKILQQLSETATNGDAYQKLLFADDTARGFAFIELCRKKYDVIVMNPPFGVASLNSKEYIDSYYPISKNDLASVFVERMIELLQQESIMGSITTRTIFFLGSYTQWRTKYLIEENSIKYFADLGGGVLDAMVETSAYLIQKGKSNQKSLFLRATKEENKANKITTIINNPLHEDLFQIDPIYFKLISNTPICYWLDAKTLKLFEESPKFLKNERAVRQGLGLSDSFRYCRMFWEVKNNNIGFSESDTQNDKYWVRYINTTGAIPFYYDSYNCLYWKDNGHEIKRAVEVEYGSYSKRVCGESSYFSPGLSWAYRTAKFQPHIIPVGEIFTTARFITTFNSNDELFSTVSFWNTEYIDYCLKLSMEKDLQPKFISGTVNQLPFPSLPEKIESELKDIALSQYKRVREVFRLDDRSVAFTSNEFLHHKSLNSFVDYYLNHLGEVKSSYKLKMIELNNLIYDHFNISLQERKEINDIVSAAGDSDFGKIFNSDKEEVFTRIISILLGCVFQRWDVRILKNWNQDWYDEGIFKSRQQSPFYFGEKVSLLDLISPECHHQVLKIYDQTYPIKTLSGAATVNDLVKRFREVILFFWPDTSSEIEVDLLEYFGVSELQFIFSNPNKLFDHHLKDYSRNKRVSPIYWPISTTSGSFTIWIYYPKMNEQTLYKIVSDFIIPKKEEVADEVKKLELNSTLDNNGKKQLLELQDLLHELQVMEKELIEVAELPYKPNHDDGVLITAAPLNKFFRHYKWRNATETCWKALEKGEYDWAHLAYSIWPDRVTKKCKKDLSMAIAHGLEDICEVKPKEKKEKKVAKPKKHASQGKLID